MTEGRRSLRPLLLGAALLTLGAAVVMLGFRPDAGFRYSAEEALAVLNDRERPWFKRPPLPTETPQAANGAPLIDEERPPANAWQMPAVAVKYMLVDRRPVGPDHPFCGRHFEIVDLRSDDEYAVGHVRYAVSVPWAQFDASAAAGELSRLEKECILILYGARHPHGKVVERFRAAGWTRLYVLQGGLREWKVRGFEVAKTAAQIVKESEIAYVDEKMRDARKRAGRHPAGGDLKLRMISYEGVPLITPEKLKQKIDGGEPFEFVYVSDKSLFERKRIAGSRWVPLSKIAEEFKSMPREREVVFYCGCCEGKSLGMSGWAVDALLQMGFQKVSHLEGHTKAWEVAGYPVEGKP